MTTTARAASPATSALLVLAGAVASAILTTVIALAATAAGAPSSYGPLQPVAYLTFAVAGTLAGIGGWVLIARRARRPARLLRVLVPVLVLVSLVPDVILLITSFIPGTTPVAVVGLMLMHPVVAAVAVLVGRRIAPAA
ncbi:DUF6069 family protein [Microbacterium rhizophilus]|uniref:DUF6069 family protein n=1 Tax=Microbacterium rhizophilus TaxID=3138934 RepID=UPI0031EC6977